MLLDDPLSAVDARVGRVLFGECIGPGGLMQVRRSLAGASGLNLINLLLPGNARVRRVFFGEYSGLAVCVSHLFIITQNCMVRLAWRSTDMGWQTTVSALYSPRWQNCYACEPVA